MEGWTDAAQARAARRCARLLRGVRIFSDAERYSVFVATLHPRSFISWDKDVDNAATCRKILK